MWRGCNRNIKFVGIATESVGRAVSGDAHFQLFLLAAWQRDALCSWTFSSNEFFSNNGGQFFAPPGKDKILAGRTSDRKRPVRGGSRGQICGAKALFLRFNWRKQYDKIAHSLVRSLRKHMSRKQPCSGGNDDPHRSCFGSLKHLEGRTLQVLAVIAQQGLGSRLLLWRPQLAPWPAFLAKGLPVRKEQAPKPIWKNPDQNERARSAFSYCGVSMTLLQFRETNSLEKVQEVCHPDHCFSLLTDREKRKGDPCGHTARARQLRSMSFLQKQY